MTGKQYFDDNTFAFIHELKANNTKEWFTENKPRFEKHMKASMLSFIGDLGPELEKVSKHIVADPRPNGGSMFRIYRDVRFSKDKSPYKTHLSAQFRHAAGKDVHAPGFYLHIEPGNCIFGAGIWKPDNPTLAKIRAAIDENQDRWIQLRNDKKLFAEGTLRGDSLKRNPQGFDTDHPLIEDIKRKDFMIVVEVEDSVITGEDIVGQFTAWCSTTAPLMNFICDALEIDW